MSSERWICKMHSLMWILLLEKNEWVKRSRRREAKLEDKGLEGI